MTTKLKLHIMQLCLWMLKSLNINILTCSEAYNMALMLKSISLSYMYIAQNHSSLTVLKYIIYRLLMAAEF